MAGIIFGAVPQIPGAPASRWMTTDITWTGWDGSVWDLTSRYSSVVLLNDGVEGLHMPKFREWTRQSPMIPGQTFAGMIAEPRNVVLPLVIYNDTGSYEWMSQDKAFWRSMHPAREGTLSVRFAGGGSTRTLRCRYVPEDQAFPLDPALDVWAKYAVVLVADQPFWAGPKIVRQWDGRVDTRNFYETAGPHLVNVNFGHTIGNAEIPNDGDEDAWPVWTVIGPVTSATLGVGTNVVDVPFAVPAGKALVVDTNPRLQTAMEYDYTAGVAFASDKFENPVDRTPELTGRVDFAPIPAGESNKLNLSINGDGLIRAEVTPLYWRAW